MTGFPSISGYKVFRFSPDRRDALVAMLVERATPGDTEAPERAWRAIEYVESALSRRARFKRLQGVAERLLSRVKGDGHTRFKQMAAELKRRRVNVKTASARSIITLAEFELFAEKDGSGGPKQSPHTALVKRLQTGRPLAKIIDECTSPELALLEDAQGLAELLGRPIEKHVLVEIIKNPPDGSGPFKVRPVYYGVEVEIEKTRQRQPEDRDALAAIVDAWQYATGTTKVSGGGEAMAIAQFIDAAIVGYRWGGLGGVENASACETKWPLRMTVESLNRADNLILDYLAFSYPE